MDKSIVIEMVEFKIISGISDADFIKIVDSLETNFHSKQKGFISTELAKGKEKGYWMMIQHWESMEDAKEVIKMMMKTPITEEFRKVLEPTSVKMSLLGQVSLWDKCS